jgi:beta-glucosidase
LGESNSKFYWGVATSAFQLEGSPCADWSLWDPALCKYPDATRHFHLYKEDLSLLTGLGVNAYRFSLEWSRIQPRENAWDDDVLAHYREIVDICRANGIEPFVGPSPTNTSLNVCPADRRRA